MATYELAALVDFMPVNPIARSLEDFGEFVICQAPCSPATGQSPSVTNSVQEPFIRSDTDPGLATFPLKIQKATKGP